MFVRMSATYKPRRDIPKAVRELKTLSPTKIKEWIREHRVRKQKLTGKMIQVNVTPQSITMWFKRNPHIYSTLDQELKDEQLPKLVISESIYENGTFRAISSIRDWIRDLTNNGAKTAVITRWVSMIKRVCKGNLKIVGGRQDIETWGLKHPDRLTVEDAKNFLFEIKKRSIRSREWRLALRSFLSSKGIVVKSSDISGELEEDAGKYSDLYTAKQNIYATLEWLKPISKDAYLASKFGYKTASRITATLNAHASYLNHEDHTITVLEKATKGKKKRRMVKLIPDDLWEEIPKEGKLFNIKPHELNTLLRQAYKEVIPELAERIPMPFHFWRHMFAQHMLRASNWNYGLVASLGDWTTNALEKYYGMPPKEVIRKFGLETLPKI